MDDHQPSFFMNPVTSVTVIPLATVTSLAANSDTLPTVVTLIQMSTLTLLFVVFALDWAGRPTPPIERNDTWDITDLPVVDASTR